MTPPFLNPQGRPAPLVLSVLAAGAFYWGLFRAPLTQGQDASLSPEKSRQLQEESAVMRRYGNWARALPPTLRLHDAYPENHIYTGELAEIYQHLGRYSEEAAMWESYMAQAPRPIEACPQVGIAYQKAGEVPAAVSALEKCLALEPANPDSIFYLARALERDGQTDRAAELYTRGVELSPAYLDLQIGLARTRLHQGKAAEARAMAEKIAAASPNNVDALLVAGLACEQLGDRATARGYLERGAGLADSYVDFHVALGKLAEQDANLDQAIQQYQKVAELDKSNTAVIQKLSLLRRARQ